MKKIRHRWILRFVILLILVAGCSKKSSWQDPPADLPEHTLVYGGDFTLSRSLNESLFVPALRKDILKDVSGLFKNADIALVNGEGVISQGGYFFDKGEPRPYMYRAHPLAIEPLKDAGIDIINVGNNHFGDYGPEAMKEMLDRLQAAGINYTGGGYNIKDAKQPSYYKAGDVTVAVIGGDFTLAAPFKAGLNKPGTNYYNAFRTDKFEDGIVNDLTKIYNEARKHAHIVILSPHWGDNWLTEPAPEIKKLARRLIKIGFDGIIGHSAHLYQGVELIDGKPVIYDAGNLVSDFSPADNSRFAIAWKLTFTKAGITKAEGFPLLLRKNKTMYASGKNADFVLEDLAKKSTRMKTPLTITNNSAVLNCNPGKMFIPIDTENIPKRNKSTTIRLAPDDTVISHLPRSATPCNVEFEGGIKMTGFELLIKDISTPKGAQVFITYWQTDKKTDGNYQIYQEARQITSSGVEGARNASMHIPGDWLFPVNKWEPGKTIRDWTLFRLTFNPVGEVNFYVSLTKDGKKLAPLKSDKPVVNSNLIFLGKGKYSKDAKRVFYYLNQYRQHSH
ncbi:MAG: CapA family protein, partial [Deltaproteobacteria bacterium]|nr:CapA family protein [Deltaproteobacteria bacterium]